MSATSSPMFGKRSESVRSAVFAGEWYPGDSTVLTQTIDELLADGTQNTTDDKPIAIIVPHAGYRYSAPVAATAFRALQEHVYDRVVGLAFNHRLASTYAGVVADCDHSAYRTPLGDVPVDINACRSLIGVDALHAAPGIADGEHSLELQLPFLQRVIGSFSLVPLYVGQLTHQGQARAAAAISTIVDNRTLLLVSTDFTHYGPRFGFKPFLDDIENRLNEYANQAADVIGRVDYDGFVSYIDRTQDTICGRHAVALLLRLLSMRGGAACIRTGVDTSGRLTGGYHNSVTYQSFVFTPRKFALSEAERKQLLDLARLSAQSHLSGRGQPSIDQAALPDALRERGACFVTLKNRGSLRGCIGHITANDALFDSVMHNAVSACNDYRFANARITESELVNEIDIEISHITPMEPVDRVENIVVGRHGLYIAGRGRRGVLLPQVASERGWTREEFLIQICRKAGIAEDAWCEKDTKLFRFEAQVFGE